MLALQLAVALAVAAFVCLMRPARMATYLVDFYCYRPPDRSVTNTHSKYTIPTPLENFLCQVHARVSGIWFGWLNSTKFLHVGRSYSNFGWLRSAECSRKCAHATSKTVCLCQLPC